MFDDAIFSISKKHLDVSAAAFPTANPKNARPIMPELPEVETSRRYVEEFCLSSTITRVNATEQGGGPVRRIVLCDSDSCTESLLGTPLLCVLLLLSNCSLQL